MNAHATNGQVVIVPMSVGDARRCVEVVKDHLDSARRALLALYEGQGWRALGYGSWHECVTAEFGQSQAQVYRLLDAAQIDRVISPIGESPPLPESHTRELSPLLRESGAAAVVEIYQELRAEHGDKVTAESIREAVQTRLRRSARRSDIPILKYPPDPTERPLTETERAENTKRHVRAGLLALWAVDAWGLLTNLAPMSPDIGTRSRIATMLERFPTRPILYDADEQVLISPDFQTCTPITAAECVVICRLMDVPGWMVNLGQLLEALNWQWGWGTGDSVRKMIVDLRRKLILLGWSEYIFENERDVGWKVNKGEIADAWTVYVQSLSTPILTPN